MFPIRNVKGECIGFGGRVLGDEKPKYLNSPETPVFSKGRELYGLYEARAALREAGYALVTEGYMDVVALAQLGFPNAVATLGTACTTEHVQKLFRFTDSGGVQLRRRRRRSSGRAQGARRRTALCHRRALASSSCSCRRSTTRTATSASMVATPLPRASSEATPLSRFMIEAAREGCDVRQPKAAPT
jgi:DNA primase